MKQIQMALNGLQSLPEEVADLNLDGRIQRAVELLRLHEPEEGYYVAFSGGKDSTAIKWLVEQAGVKFEAWYNNTTIDPPELVRFIKKQHPDVQWNQPEMPMMTMVATAPKVPPTRSGRWCCSVYKEGGGSGRVKVMGVRAAESKRRAMNWRELAEDMHGNPTICPIVYWSDAHVWELLKGRQVPYCTLYDEGFTRLGCVGCPLSPGSQAAEFARWPNYERNWKKAIIANWEKWHNVPRQRDGKPRYHTKFKTGEEFWQWWLTAKSPDLFREDCQSGMLWTNQELDDS